MRGRSRRYEIAGWVLFGLGVLAFVVQGVASGEVLTIVGSVLFLLGVIAFLVPYTWSDEG